ncbi:type I restriction endonuclease subunit M, partial [Candidatus Roizmanbacteria bacterium CG_4_10_14_0_8_um_filter_33_9]
VWILNKNKPENKKNKILFIEGEHDFKEGKNQNTLRKQDIDKIIKTYDQYQDVEKYARVVDKKEIEDNEYNLNVRRYIDSNEEQEIIDVKKVWQELNVLEKEREEISKKVAGFIKELGYSQ